MDLAPKHLVSVHQTFDKDQKTAKLQAKNF